MMTVFQQQESPGVTCDKNGHSGKDCVKTDDDTATCLNPSSLEWIQTSFFLKEGKKKQCI